MAIGPLTAWNSANNYDNANKWGTGLDPIHYSRDEGLGRELNFSGSGETVDESLTSDDFGYGHGDYYGPMSDYGMREVPTDHVGWNKTPDRAELPGNYPDWSPDSNDNVEANEFRSIPHMSAEEAFLTFQGPYQSVTGQMLSKSTSYENQPVVPSPDNFYLNTSMKQGPDTGVLENSRAQAIGLPARSPIQSRQSAMKVQPYAKSFEMGGGQDTPRMLPAQRPDIKRPFFYRTAHLPVAPQLQMNLNGPNTTYAGVSAATPPAGVALDSSSTNNYGYTSGDYYG